MNNQYYKTFTVASGQWISGSVISGQLDLLESPYCVLNSLSSGCQFAISGDYRGNKFNFDSFSSVAGQVTIHNRQYYTGILPTKSIVFIWNSVGGTGSTVFLDVLARNF